MLEPHIAPPACVTEDAFAALMEITRRPPVVFVEGRGSWLTIRRERNISISSRAGQSIVWAIVPQQSSARSSRRPSNF